MRKTVFSIIALLLAVLYLPAAVEAEGSTETYLEHIQTHPHIVLGRDGQAALTSHSPHHRTAVQSSFVFMLTFDDPDRDWIVGRVLHGSKEGAEIVFWVSGIKVDPPKGSAQQAPIIGPGFYPVGNVARIVDNPIHLPPGQYQAQFFRVTSRGEAGGQVPLESLPTFVWNFDVAEDGESPDDFESPRPTPVPSALGIGIMRRF